MGKGVEMVYANSSKRIRETRVRRGLSVSQLAEYANISTKFMYHIEEGKGGFSAKVLNDIARALNVSCDYILKGSENSVLSSLSDMIGQLDFREQIAVERILIEIVDLIEYHDEKNKKK